jgi:formylglycine-generating enzyme required for sulfatase activity
MKRGSDMIHRVGPLIAGMALVAEPGLSNNVQVANTRLEGFPGRRVGVTFDVSWENSWRDTINYDACWLFIKYSVDGGSSWHHATLAASGTNPTDFSPGTNANAAIYVPADRKGAFIQPAGLETGTFGSRNVTLVWDLVPAGLWSTNSGRVKVFATEMVYIPQGPFYVGDDSSACAFYVTHITTPDVSKTSGSGAGTIASPYEDAVTGVGLPKGITGAFSSSYPNGYNAFYVMKYEMTRGQYLDFLNLLPAAAAVTNVPALGTRSSTVTGTHPNYGNAVPFAPCGFTAVTRLSGWAWGTAYLDWAALRPMTEMEFEKACRGPNLPLDQEYPWGTTGKKEIKRGTLLNKDTEQETRSNLDDNMNDVVVGNLTLGGPLRGGALATPTTDQVQAGASYYGVLNLADNINERCISTGPNARSGACDAKARAFDGQHGDGEVDAVGNANVATWPGEDAVGSSFRGGCADATAQQGRVADRTYGGRTYAYSYANGLRGARTR